MEHKRPKDNHYPPIANQAPRGRGLNNLFRRSLGGGSSGGGAAAAATESAPASATEPTFAAAAANAPASRCGGGGGAAIGIPSWIHRTNAADDDRASATPPPIMRNRAPGRKGSFDGDFGGVSLLANSGSSQQPPSTPMTPMTPVTPMGNGAPLAPTTPHTTASGGTLTRRKWLPGFGRNSSRNRAG
jgi:hypothetical protein